MSDSGSNSVSDDNDKNEVLNETVRSEEDETPTESENEDFN